jgi:hypothetical protein
MHIGHPGLLIAMQIVLPAGRRSWAIDLWPTAVSFLAGSTSRALAWLRRLVAVAGWRHVSCCRPGAAGLGQLLHLPLLIDRCERPLEVGRPAAPFVTM